MDLGVKFPTNVKDAAQLTATAIGQLDGPRTVAFCAVSPLEVHGPHLPIGADLHQAQWAADEMARRFAESHPAWTVLRFPAIPLAADVLPLKGSFSYPHRLVYRSLLVFGQSLQKMGVRTIVLTNAHGGPRHAAAIEAACRKISKRYGIQMISPSIRALHRMITGQCLDEVEKRLGRSLSDDERQGFTNGEHAGSWETSWYLARFPEWVEPEYASLPEDHPPAIPWIQRLGQQIEKGLSAIGAEEGGKSVATIFSSLARSFGWVLNCRSGYGRDGKRVNYSGWPAVASAEMGELYCDLPVEMGLADLEAVIDGKKSAEEIRSIASDPWVIQPQFTPIALGVIALLLFWWSH